MVTTTPQSIGSTSPSPASSGARTLISIVGMACLAGFLIDILMLALPPNPGSLEWRVTFLQQLGDRAIILLFGVAMMMFSILNVRAARRNFAMVSLGIGAALLLSCVLVIRDGFVLQNQALANITNRANQAQEQIAAAKLNPPKDVDMAKLDQLEGQLKQQAETLQSNTKTGVLKTAARSVGNLAVIGMALVGIGRYGLRSNRHF
jgi:hypothetical protein